MQQSTYRRQSWWSWLTERWNRTPGYLKWLGGLLLGALVRVAFERLFPERWGRISHTLLDPTVPIWLALVGLILVLIAERALPSLYRRTRSRTPERRFKTLFGVRWIGPPDAESVTGPYCTVHSVLLRGVMWSGDASPTLWMCPVCKREFVTPEFPDIRREVAGELRRAG
jgi:hypothetical protein